MIDSGKASPRLSSVKLSRFVVIKEHIEQRSRVPIIASRACHNYILPSRAACRKGPTVAGPQILVVRPPRFTRRLIRSTSSSSWSQTAPAIQNTTCSLTSRTPFTRLSFGEPHQLRAPAVLYSHRPDIVSFERSLPGVAPIHSHRRQRHRCKVPSPSQPVHTQQLRPS
jgi:hypothetical protein